MSECIDAQSFAVIPTQCPQISDFVNLRHRNLCEYQPKKQEPFRLHEPSSLGKYGRAANYQPLASLRLQRAGPVTLVFVPRRVHSRYRTFGTKRKKSDP